MQRYAALACLQIHEALSRNQLTPELVEEVPLPGDTSMIAIKLLAANEWATMASVWKSVSQEVRKCLREEAIASLKKVHDMRLPIKQQQDTPAQSSDPSGKLHWVMLGQPTTW